jgi:hypothetical protein
MCLAAPLRARARDIGRSTFRALGRSTGTDTIKTLHYLMNKNVLGSEITPTLSLHMEKVGFAK